MSNDRAFTLWRAFQLTLPRATTGWLFAILQNNFNRVSIVEMGIAAVTITTMIGLFHFLSPFQVIFGHLSDRFPIFGYRRSPYILAGITLSGVAVSVLPDIGILISQGVPWAYAAGVGAMALFGIGFAMSGVTHLALVADVAPSKYRGPVIASIWVMLLVGMITSLAFIRWYMPDYDLTTMRELYALSIPIVFFLTLLGLFGMEKRVTREEAAILRAEADRKTEEDKKSSPKFIEFIRTAFSNVSTRSFFLFVFVTTLGVGLQDTILEVFGANVLGMSVGETGLFEQVLRGGALVGMIIMGFVSYKWGISKLKSIVFWSLWLRVFYLRYCLCRDYCRQEFGHLLVDFGGPCPGLLYCGCPDHDDGDDHRSRTRVLYGTVGACVNHRQWLCRDRGRGIGYGANRKPTVRRGSGLRSDLRVGGANPDHRDYFYLQGRLIAVQPHWQN